MDDTTPAADVLLDIADRAITAGLDGRAPGKPAPDDLPPALRGPRGNFVTLDVRGRLNGCIGSLVDTEPLAVSVARHAWSAAFDDPRLPPLCRSDHAHLAIKIALLSPLDPLPATTRGDLLDTLVPNVDGMVISVGSRRAVFLPAVWEHLPTATDFLARLFEKAGLAADPWPADLRALRFTAETIRRGVVVPHRDSSGGEGG